MTTYYRRKSLTSWEELAALGLGALSGAAAYYLFRTWMRRDEMEDRRATGTAAGGRSAPPPSELDRPPHESVGKEGSDAAR